MSLTPEIEDFLDGLTPDDVGFESFGDLILKFEGFTAICWDDAQDKGKSIESLEEEILLQWSTELSAPALQSDWTYEPLPYEDTVFWALFRPNTSSNSLNAN